MITGETITDDAIRELQREAEASGNELLLGYCEVALSDRFPRARPVARAMCAEAINAKVPAAQRGSSTFERLVKRVHADSQVKATVGEPELEHILHVTLNAMGFYVKDGAIHDEKPPEYIGTFENGRSRYARSPRRGRR